MFGIDNEHILRLLIKSFARITFFRFYEVHHPSTTTYIYYIYTDTHTHLPYNRAILAAQPNRKEKKKKKILNKQCTNKTCDAETTKTI